MAILTRSGLSPRDLAIIDSVTQHGQATSGQLQRLHFADGSPASRGARTRRSLARLTAAGHIAHLPRPVGGYLGGSGSYVYQPPASRARIGDPHRLAITELRVCLTEWHRRATGELVDFQPEPECHRNLGTIQLKPDAWLRIRQGGRGRQAFIELDRGTESSTEVSRKLGTYTAACAAWTEGPFPLVLFVVEHELPECEAQRCELIGRTIRGHHSSGLFAVCQFDDTIPTLTTSPNEGATNEAI